MPSKDDFHEKKPETTAWLESEPTKPAPRVMSAQIQRLADRTGQDPDELAARLSADTVRRTKFPVIEQRDEQGRRVFRSDPGIVNDGRRGLVSK